MNGKQNIPTVGEIDRQLLPPLFTANIQTSVDGALAVTVLPWHSQRITKLTLSSPNGSQTIILDHDALKDLCFAASQALNAAEG